MILPVVAYGMPALRKKSKLVLQSYEGLDELIRNLWDTLDNAGGVGLAAPQVNADVSIFIVNTLKSAGEGEMTGGERGIKKVFINPEILSASEDSWTDEEGCLSIPGLAADVERPLHITIRYQDETFQSFTESYSGYTARVIQHEYDHVTGKLYLDHLSPLRRRLLDRRLERIRKGQVKTSYPMLFLPK